MSMAARTAVASRLLNSRLLSLTSLYAHKGGRLGISYQARYRTSFRASSRDVSNDPGHLVASSDHSTLGLKADLVLNTRFMDAGSESNTSCWPQHAIVQVEGQPTEVYRTRSSAGHSDLQVLILPGNPGSAGYYEAYIAALHAALHGKADVHAVSHLGHASSRKARLTRSQAFGLQEQINHKVAYVLEHLTGPQAAPIVIVGHSIGAYMALKVTKQLQTLSKSPAVAKVLAVFPFFQVDFTSSQQKMMYRLTTVPRLMGILGAAMGYLPLAIQRWLVNWWGGGLEDYAEQATLGLLNYHTIKNGFYLGGTEFQDLAGPVDWKQLDELGEKVAVICNPNDTWFSQRSWEQMWLQLPNIKAYMEEAQRHDFCVSRQLSASLAQKSAELLQELLPERG